jgi:hypothetical protein
MKAAARGQGANFELRMFAELIAYSCSAIPPPLFTESAGSSTLLFKKPRVNRTGNVSVDLFKGKTRGK